MEARHNGLGGVADALDGLLEARHGLFERVPLPRGGHHRHLAEVRADGEVRAFVADDEAAQVGIVLDAGDALDEAVHHVEAEAIGLGAELVEHHAVAQIQQRRLVVLPHLLRGVGLDRGEAQLVLGNVERRVALPRHIHAAVAVELRDARRLHLAHPRGQRDPGLVQLLQDGVEAEGVPDLERPHLPAEAPFDGVVHRRGRSGDLGDAAGGVGEGVERGRANVRPDPPLVVEQRGVALGERTDLFVVVQPRQVERLGGFVPTGLRVDRQDVLADLLVEAGLRFGPERAVLDELVQQRRHAEALARLVALGLGVEVVRHVAEHVEADHVRRAERGALGVADERAGERVKFLHRVRARRQRLHRAEDGVGADAVAHEVRHVVGHHDALAEVHPPELRHALHHGGVGVGRRDEFEQLEVARRVEEVRAEQPLAEALAPPLADLADRDAGRVGADHGGVGGRGLDPFHQPALHVEPLDHRLDDEVGILDPVEVLVEVAEAHAGLGGVVEKRRRVHLRQRRPCLLDEAVGRARLADGGRRDVEQIHRQACVGAVGGDLCAHRARAEHGDLAKRKRRVHRLVWDGRQKRPRGTSRRATGGCGTTGCSRTALTRTRRTR